MKKLLPLCVGAALVFSAGISIQASAATAYCYASLNKHKNPKRVLLEDYVLNNSKTSGKFWHVETLIVQEWKGKTIGYKTVSRKGGGFWRYSPNSNVCKDVTGAYKYKA